MPHMAQRALAILFALLVAVPAPLAAARFLEAPGALTGIVAQTELPALPSLPARVPSPFEDGHAAQTWAYASGSHDGVVAAAGVPLVMVDGAQPRSMLAFPPDVRARLDPALLDVRALMEEDLIAEDGTVRVIARAAPAAIEHLLDGRPLGATGLLAGRLALDDLAALARDGRVERIWLDRPAEASLEQTLPIIRATEAHERTAPGGGPLLGNGTLIAILDTGIDYSHADLGGCFGEGCKVVGGYDFVNGDTDPMDDHGHGTHVAATAAGSQGVAPGADVLAYKVLDSEGYGWYSDIVAAIEAAVAAEADVISMSLGGGGTSDGPLATSVDWAVGQGVVVVSAAGNWGSWGYGTVGEPAASLRGIAVGATDKRDLMASFSSRGPVYDMAGEITGVKPDVTAPGVDVYAAVPTGACRLCNPSGYQSLSGTSMATPHVAGAAALLLQAHPTWSAIEVKAALVAGAVEKGYPARVEGAGRIDVVRALDVGLVVMPTSGWLGLDLASDARYVPDLPVTVRNLGDQTATVDLSVALGAPRVDEVPYVIDVASPPTVPLPRDPNAVVKFENILADGGAREAGRYAILTMPDGESWWVSLDDAGDGMLRAEQALPLDRVGNWTLRDEWGGDIVTFRVAATQRATVGALSPPSLTLAPGESATARVMTAFDNAALATGWNELAVTAGDGALRMSFVKGSVLRLHLTESALLAAVSVDGKLLRVVGWDGARDYTIHGPAGDWSVVAAWEECPPTAIECDRAALSWAGREGVVVSGITHLTLTPATSTHDGRVVAQTTVGPVDVAGLPPCWVLGRATAPCASGSGARVAHLGDDSWLTALGWSAGQFFGDLSANFSVGLEGHVQVGRELYLVGNATRGVAAPFIFTAGPADGLSFPLHRNLPPPFGGAMGASACVDDFGGGPILPLVPGRIQVHYQIPFDVRLPMKGGSPGANHCLNLLEAHWAGARAHFWECDDPAGCVFLGESEWLKFADGELGLADQRGAAIDDRHARPHGGVSLFDGAATLSMAGWADRWGVYVPSPFAAAYMTPGAPSYLSAFQNEARRQWINATYDGQTVADAEPGYWGHYIGFDGTPTNATLGFGFDGSPLEGLTGRSTYDVSFYTAVGGQLPVAKWMRAEADGIFGTRFANGSTRTVHALLDPGESRSFITVTMTARSAEGEWTSDALVGDAGVYGASLPDLGAGAYDLVVHAMRDDGATMRVAQSPAFLVLPMPGVAAPNVTIRAPTMARNVSGLAYVSGVAHDPDGDGTILAVEYRIDGGEWRPASGTAAWHDLVDTYVLANGLHTLEARAFDGASHSLVESTTFATFNNRPPTLEILQPAEGAVLDGSFNVSGIATDPEGSYGDMRVSTDGGRTWQWLRADAEWGVRGDARRERAGDARIVVELWDGQHLVRAIRNVSYVAGPDARVDVTSHADGAPVEGTVTLSGTAAGRGAEDAIERVYVSIAGGEWTLANGTAAWNVTFDTRAFDNGALAIDVYAASSQDDASTTHHLEVVNNRAPFVGVDAPLHREILRGNVSVVGRALDPDGSVGSVQVALGSYNVTLAGNETWGTTLDTRALPNGPATLYVVALDDDGRLSQPVVVGVEISNGAANSPPKVSILDPADGQTVAGKFAVTGVASDPDGNATLVGVEMSIAGGPWREVNGTSSWWTTIDSTLYPNGWLGVSARAFDGSAYSANHTISVLVDNRAPPGIANLVLESIEIVRAPLLTDVGPAPHPAQTRIVRATIVNVGDAFAGRFDVDAAVTAAARAPGTTGEIRTAEPLGVRAVRGLGPGERVAVEWAWDTTGNVGDQTVVVRADVGDRVAEADESDNARTVRTYVHIGNAGGVAVGSLATPSFDAGDVARLLPGEPAATSGVVAILGVVRDALP